MSLAETWKPTSADSTATEAPGRVAEAVPPFVRKNPVLAGLLSLFPGVGNVYNGLYLRGMTFFLVVVSLMAIASSGHDLYGFAVAFFWIFNVIDAWRQATLINYGYTQDLGLVDLPDRPRAGQGGIVAGVLLVFVGVTATLEQYFDLDLEWLFDLWPLALTVLGVALVWASIRDRRKASAAAESGGSTEG